MAVVRVGFAILCVGILIYGIMDILTNFEQNKCEMTYMFERPEYLKVPLDKDVKRKFPRYGLYIYGEGHYARTISNMKLHGIPVLFIPGNGGSYRQVRSLGSVALRRAQDKRTRFHFNYFSVDVNEELSGLYGGVLHDQTDFVHASIKRILELYKQTSNPPSSVILVGHSMGGIVARALYTLPDFDHSLVTTIFTQATPHLSLVLSPDYKLSAFVQTVNQYWRNHAKTSLKHVTVVSTGGGFRDVLVRNGLTSIKGKWSEIAEVLSQGVSFTEIKLTPGLSQEVNLLEVIVDEEHGVYTSTMSVPNAWVSTDHLCAVWCKQMVMATKRAMFDIIDPSTLQVTKEVGKRMKVFRHHFLSHSGISALDTYEDELRLDAGVKWVVMEDKLWEYARSQVQNAKYLAVPLNKDGVDSFMAISDVMRKNWICACRLADREKQCTKCKNLSYKGHLIPPKDSQRKVVHLALNELQGMTHIVLIIPQSREKVEVMADMYNKGQRHLAYKMPSFLDILMTYPESVTTSASKLTLFNDTMYYSLNLQGIYTVLQAYRVSLQPKKCVKSGLHAGSMMVFYVPWSHDDTYTFSSLQETGNISVKLQTGVSVSLDDDDIQLQVYTDPSCTYLLNFVASPSEMLGQLARFYFPLLPCFMVAVFLMGIVQQLYVIGRDSKCPSILDAIGANAQPFKLVPLVVILRIVVQLETVAKIIRNVGIPADDGVQMLDQGIYFRPLPLLMYIIALGIVTFNCYVISIAFQILAKVLGLLFGWFPSALWTKIEVLLMCLSIIGSVLLCSSLGIFICYILYFIKVIILKYQSSSSKSVESRYNFFVSLLMLWMWTMVLTAPSLFMWLKNLRFSVFLHGDPNWTLATIGIISMNIILFLDNPLPPQMSYRGVYFSVYAAAVLVLLYGMTSTYRVPYAIVYTMSSIAAYQVVYKLQPPNTSSANSIHQ